MTNKILYPEKKKARHGDIHLHVRVFDGLVTQTHLEKKRNIKYYLLEMVLPFVTNIWMSQSLILGNCGKNSTLTYFA